jgi:hypothetical protein
MAGQASRHAHLDGAPHFHVIAESYDGELMCSDGFTWPGAQGFVADLISPPNGVRIYEPVQTVWIIEGESPRCPFAHGGDIPADEAAAQEFLDQVLQQQPYWSA